MRTILVLSAILALTKGEANDISAHSWEGNPGYRTDDYVNVNRQQYSRNIQHYDANIQAFKDRFSVRADTIRVQLEMLISSIIQTEERLNPLELLSDFNKKCVAKYRSSIPTVETTKTKIAICSDQATSQLNSLVSTPQTVRYNLQNYYTNSFEQEIKKCGNRYDNRTVNYTTCVTSVVNNTNTYTISNQKTFNIQMDAAECSANAYINRALDCSYTIQSQTLTSLAEANFLINNCLLGKDRCEPCQICHTCRETHTFLQDYKNVTMLNPFYRRENSTNYILLLALKPGMPVPTNP